MPLRISKSGSTIATFKILNFDSDAQTFLTAAGITNSTQQNAINKLTIDLKYYGLWTKMKALYPVVGGTSAAHAVNLKTPGTYNLSFTAGWTHSSTGMTPNGTSDYANTGLASNTVQTTNHLSFYSRTQTVGVQVEMGIWEASNNTFNQIRPAANYYAGDLNNGFISFTTTSDARGFWIGTKRANNDREGYRNGVSQATSTTTDNSTLPAGNIYIGARNQLNTSPSIQLYSNKQCAFASIGDGLTDQDAINFYNIVQRYQINLGRQV
jgi:hypothetical protein